MYNSLLSLSNTLIQITKDYPNSPMGVTVTSYQPPKVIFTKSDAKFHLFATTKFSVKDKELFTFKFVSVIIH